MSSGLDTMRGMSRRSLIVRVSLIGAGAGFAAWLLVWVASPLFDVDRPSLLALVLAVPRGALFGAIAAWLLHAHWRKQAAKRAATGS